MKELVDGLILYHGSYCEIRKPQLEKCAKRKDFGKGFYLTTSREQAISFLKTALAKAEAGKIIEPGQNYGVVSMFEVEKEMARFDVIAGKIADDATNRTLVAYVSGTFGKMGSERADEFCISQLMPGRLNDQYCFKTERALECLRFVEGEKIWLKQ